MAEFPSEDWLNEYVKRINASPEYKEASATWEGDVAFVFEAEPDKGVPEDVWAWLDLWHGECRAGQARRRRGGREGASSSSARPTPGGRRSSARSSTR